MLEEIRTNRAEPNFDSPASGAEEGRTGGDEMIDFEYPGRESMICSPWESEMNDQCSDCPFASVEACKNQCAEETEIYNPILSQIAAKQNRRNEK